MRVQAFVAKATVERLYEGIVRRLARSAEVQRDTLLSYAQRSSAFEINSGPLSTRMVLGAPRIDEIRAIASTTCSPLMPWSTSIARASRVKASTTVSARNRRPSNRASETKSIDHISFAASSRRLPLAVGSADVAPGPLEPKAQSIITVEPVDALVVHDPSFPAQQDVDPEIAIARSRRRQITDAHHQRRLIRLDARCSAPTTARRPAPSNCAARLPPWDAWTCATSSRRRPGVRAFLPERPAGYACRGSDPRPAA